MSFPPFSFASRFFGSVALCAVSMLLFSSFVEAQSGTADNRSVSQRARARPERVLNTMFGNNPPPPGTVSIIGRSVVKSVGGAGAGNNGPFFAAVDNEPIRKDLGLTDAQVEKIRTVRDELNAQILLKSGHYALRFKKMTPADHAAIEKDISAEIQSYSEKIKGIVTDEQMNKSRTLIFQASGGLDSPIANPDTLGMLDLSEEQKKQAADIFRAKDAERLELMEEGLKLVEKRVALGKDATPEQREELRKERKMFEAKVFASGKQLGDAIRPILTESQRTQAVRLMANRPSYLPRLPGPLGEMIGSGEEYRPGSDSWRPGQGIPDSHKSQDPQPDQPKRKRGFPRKG